MYSHQINAYKTQQTTEPSGRELEASVLTKAGMLLKAVQENWHQPDRAEKLQEAVRYNQKVWSFFQAELSDPANPLPTKLKQDILNLSLFVDKRLFEVISDPKPEKLGIIIDINFNIAEGLRSH